MGLIDCGVHGRSGIRHVCDHIAVAVRAGGTVPACEGWPLEIDGVPGLPHWMVLELCGACATERALPFPPRPLTLAEQDGVHRDALHAVPVCHAVHGRAESVVLSATGVTATS